MLPTKGRRDICRTHRWTAGQTDVGNGQSTVESRPVHTDDTFPFEFNFNLRPTAVFWCPGNWQWALAERNEHSVHTPDQRAGAG